MSETIRLVIADDHYLFLEGIKTVINRSYPDIRIVGCASDGEAACRLVTELEPDVLLIDAKMPGMDGIKAITHLRTAGATLRILVLTTFDEHRLVRDALSAGANGYLLKDMRIIEIIEAVRASFSGNVQISPKAADSLIGGYARIDLDSELQTNREYLELTSRQQKILSLVVNGLDNPEIAEQLCISEKTVRNHISAIYHILDVKNRSQLILWALARGIE